MMHSPWKTLLGVTMQTADMRENKIVTLLIIFSFSGMIENKTHLHLYLISRLTKVTVRLYFHCISTCAGGTLAVVAQIITGIHTAPTILTRKLKAFTLCKIIKMSNNKCLP